MLWIVFFIGLLIGANVGIVIAGMLFSSRERAGICSNNSGEEHGYTGVQGNVPAETQVQTIGKGLPEQKSTLNLHPS